VAAKHEDKADCVGNFDSPDPHNSALCLPWVQLWKISTESFDVVVIICEEKMWNEWMT